MYGNYTTRLYNGQLVGVLCFVMEKGELTSLEIIERLIRQGRDIAMSTHEGLNPGTAEEQERMPTSRYLDWKYEAGDFLHKADFRDECEFFREADGIPLLLGGEDMGDFYSPRMQQFRAIIRREMPKKLETLRHVRAELKKGIRRHIKLGFDAANSVLYVRGQPIKISRSSGQFELLRTLLVNPDEVGKEWSLSELVELIDGISELDKSKKGWKEYRKKYYNAAYEIRGKVAVAGYPDFFITTSRTVQIAPQYLS